MFWEEEACAAPGGGHKSLSLQGARAEDFLLKFKRKTSFHSAPKNVFPRGQWAPFCASEGRRGGRSGDLCALASPADSRPFPPQSREHGLRFQRPTEARVRTCAHLPERKCPAGRASGPGEPRTLCLRPHGCGDLPQGASIVASREGRTGLGLGLGPRSLRAPPCSGQQVEISGPWPAAALSPSSPAGARPPLPVPLCYSPPRPCSPVRESFGLRQPPSLHSRGLREKGEPGHEGDLRRATAD